MLFMKCHCVKKLGFRVQLVCRVEFSLCLFISQLWILCEFGSVTLLWSTNWWKIAGHLLQDNAVTHTANISLVASDEVFGKWVICLGFWPLWSPNLSTYDIYLWGTLKEKISYEQSVHFGRTESKYLVWNFCFSYTATYSHYVRNAYK
jgi:hypothetical protein